MSEVRFFDVFDVLVEFSREGMRMIERVWDEWFMRGGLLMPLLMRLPIGQNRLRLDVFHIQVMISQLFALIFVNSEHVI